ncbi:MAG: ATPase [gamma proteobacterium symbiont of Bathyaustriella thionipta]|nr:ATPase [gamma proteobacterium symbiont of Bathyaustriella thionipta]MCU7951585.1 ATPase [gamma proteobacterium symbiont of Bathyaustriella thionipta]MCU7953993.1 ATPase [gamma proteobacterium symbiont of Bathyaustriella thionipta]MCU7958187.1 ATPase [gamma proteobacterium symbiont of Bathyaustriella thionipta]MCU7968346.1 ATPase [gamma proteobacterium symbiont of Bathyaustriella thionipta]
MKFSVDEFRSWENKKVTLLGMSGVGKTYLSTLLRDSQWFHYSGDYRIGTRYLDEPIMDMIKQQAMKVPFLKELLRNDWISIKNNIKVHDLGPVLSYIGKLGNPELGGVELEDFIQRQECYREGEIAAMHDVPNFIKKAQNIYGYQHFVNDVGGSLCELDDPKVIKTLVEHTLILYIQVTNKAEENKLIERAQSAPKPLYYRPEFLQDELAVYLKENNMDYAAQMIPDEFTRWVFPRLFHSRIPRYDAIAKPHGYTVTSEEVSQIRDQQDFLQLLETAIARTV